MLARDNSALLEFNILKFLFFLSTFRIKTISGYAFAGSEHIEMLVINDNPIKVQIL